MANTLATSEALDQADDACGLLAIWRSGSQYTTGEWCLATCGRAKKDGKTRDTVIDHHIERCHTPGRRGLDSTQEVSIAVNVDRTAIARNRH